MRVHAQPRVLRWIQLERCPGSDDNCEGEDCNPPGKGTKGSDGGSSGSEGKGSKGNEGRGPWHCTKHGDGSRTCDSTPTCAPGTHPSACGACVTDGDTGDCVPPVRRVAAGSRAAASS